MSLVILSRNHNVISTHLTFMTSSNDICYICTKRLITLLFIVGICSNFQNMPRVEFPLYFNVNYFISIFANKTGFNKDSLKCILEVVHSLSNGYIIVLSYERGWVHSFAFSFPKSPYRDAVKQIYYQRHFQCNKDQLTSSLHVSDLSQE